LSNNDLIEKIRTALCNAAEALCRMDAACVERAETLIDEALQLSRSLVANGSVRPDDWPAAELLLCRQMADNTSQFWERRRAAKGSATDDTPSLFWMG